MNQENIYYLIYSPERDGYVLPSELDEEELELYRVGVFALFATKKDKPVPRCFHIRAINTGKEVDLPILIDERNRCYAQLNNGEYIFFRIQWHNKLRYVGDKGPTKFATLTPLDVTRLEELCLEQKFFFVGYDLA